VALSMVPLVMAATDAAARSPGVPSKMTLTRKQMALPAGASAQRVVFHPDGKRWATADRELVSLWDGDAAVHAFTTGTTHALRFSTDGKQLLASPQRIDVARATLEELPPPLQPTLNPLAPTFELVTAAFTPDGAELVLSASYRPRRGIGVSDKAPPEPKQLLLVDGKTRKLKRALWRGEDNDFHLLAVDAQVIAAADVDVWLWPRKDGKGHRVLKGPEHSVAALRLAPDGKRVAASDADGMVTVWETATGKQQARWKAHEGNASGLALHPRLPLVASGGNDGTIKLWTLDGAAGPAPVASAADLGGFVDDLAFSPSGDQLLAVIDGKPIRFDLSTTP
jgi:WD40 domain-containing protein